MTWPLAPLLLPPEGDRTLQSLRRKVELLALRWLLQEAPVGDLSRGMALRLARAREPILKGLKRHPEALRRAAGAPDCLPILLSWRAGLMRGESALDQLIPALMLQMLRRGVRGLEGWLWDRPLQSLPDPDRGVVWLSEAPSRGICWLRDEQLELRDREGRTLALDSLHPEPLCPAITPGIHLGLRDSNPLRDLEAHPDKTGNQVSLGGETLSRWLSTLGEALGLIEALLPEWHRELHQILSRIVPVGFESQVHYSASYREAPGLLYLTLHPSLMTLAEALIHEVQHNKLNLMYLLDPVLLNGHSDWAPSPVRPDLRPLNGVLLAAHAFVPVAVFHARLSEQGHPLAEGEAFLHRRRAVLESNQRALVTLRERARPSPAGRRLMRELDRLHEACLERADFTVSRSGGVPDFA